MIVRRETAKKVRFGRVLGVAALVGVLLGGLAAVVRHMTGLPPALVAGSVIGGGLALLTPVLNGLVRSGRAPWLVRE